MDKIFSADAYRRVIRAMVTIGGLTSAVKIVAIIKELAIASIFGTGDYLDAFLIAFLLPSFSINLIAGSLSSAFIPTYIQLREAGGAPAAQRLFSNIAVGSTILLGGFSIVLAWLGSFVLPILGSGFNPQKLALTQSLFYVLLPLIIISGWVTLCSSVLNASEKFVLASVSPILTPAAIILFIFLPGSLGIFAVATGTLIGALLEAWVLFRSLKREGIALRLEWHGIDPSTKQVIKQYMPVVAGTFLMSGTGLVDQSMAAMLGSGSVSALSYGNKLTALLLGVGSTAVGTAVFPHFSKLAAAKDWPGLRNTLSYHIKLITAFSVPVTVGLIFFSEPLVRLVFERGAFSSEDTAVVGFIQALYLIQVPFYLVGTLVVRLISSLNANHILAKATVINFILNIALNYFFILKIGVAGIALSTSLVYLVSMAYCLYALKEKAR